MAAVMAAKIIWERATNGSSNSTFQNPEGEGLIEGFVFQNSKSIRTSTVILASFNVLAAFATATGILYDCYWASKRSSRDLKASKLFILSIHPAETFPLVLAIGIVIQGLVFAGVQGTSLKSLTVKGCGTVAQFIWPALFIVPFIQAVFGLECALRSLRKRPFRARGKYSVAKCCGAIVLMLIGTWVYSHLVPEANFCFGSLVWYISRYGEESLILLSVSTGLMLFSIITIFVRLSMVTTIDKQQRIAASRIVYNNVLGIVSLAFIIPYFISQTVSHGNMKLSMMATVVLNLSGLMGGLLQLFLKSKTATIPFELKTVESWGRGMQGRMTSFNEPTFNRQLASPLSEQPIPAEPDCRPQSGDGIISPEKDRVISMESLESSPFKSPVQYDPISSKADGLDESVPAIPESITASLPGSANRTHVRKGPYSLFPGNAISPVKTSPPIIHVEPTSKYTTQNEQAINTHNLKPPPPIHFGHRRDSSVVSSATVQIGLRISQAPPQTQETIAPRASIPSSSRNEISPSPPSPLSPKLIPIALSFKRGTPPLSPRLAKGPSPLRTNNLFTRQSPRPVDANKTLPPTPKGPRFGFELPDLRIISTTQLSPVAYSPQKNEASSPKTPVSSSTSTTPLSPFPSSTTSPKRAPQAPLLTSLRSPANLLSYPGAHAGWI